jgi:hypothetical protein
MFEHDLFGKPVSTFPDHALGSAARVSGSRLRRFRLRRDQVSFACADGVCMMFARADGATSPIFVLHERAFDEAEPVAVI